MADRSDAAFCRAEGKRKVPRELLVLDVFGRPELEMADERARHDGRERGDGEAFHGLFRMGREDCDAAKGKWRGFRSGSRALFAFATARKRSRDRSPGKSIPELPRARLIC